MNLNFSFSEYQIYLLKEKAIWIPELSSLFLADLHFGKAAHFRKSGIPIPEHIHDGDLYQISNLIAQYNPAQFFFLGDLFHSDWNGQWKILIDFLADYKETQFHLVKGNHDVLSPSFYEQSTLTIHEEPFEYGKLWLSHEPANNTPAERLNLCGHIHPGVRIVGKARQTFRIPCFHLLKNQLILPAFGHFTGLALVKPTEFDKIFGVTGEKVIQIL